MGWKLKTVQTILSILAFYITSAVGEDEEPRSECADFNSTTWLEYRQQGSKLQLQYLLLTRKNTDCASLFSQESLSNNTSYFNSSLPTKIIVHGYRALGSKPSWVKQLAQALLRVQDANVVVVDWVYGASLAYNMVVENYKEVAIQISVLINQLQNHGCKLESFHFIGVSLGAHVSGFVGTLFNGKIGRITGLDPAGPMFKRADTFDRLDPSDALFVEAIHTDSDYFGISIPVGHADFFLNGGMDQAGCSRSRFSSMYRYVICDHMRALHVYISALNGTCPLTGIPCSSYEDFLKGRCLGCPGRCPRIGLLENSGLTVFPLPQLKKLFLLTTSAPPFCAHHILVQLEVFLLHKSAEVQVILRTGGHPETEQRLRLQTGGTMYRRVIAHPGPLCEIDSIQLKNTGAHFYRQGDIHVVSVCISEFPSVGEVEPLCVKKIDVRRGSPWNHDFVQLCENY
ncbi:phospholipase A1 member A precursor [Salmo salar]|uniref:Phospholipase A1 member A n=2 Tax=Salmo salar TaxID=8030 RepID=B5X239_SALSA|nr:phospholipase A1 member A precursor [Salmo salar]ACI33370.1 Phospholipase A1 member A precursor [Salmo salar]|eukprot:NP_001133507.1 phospholipase A1 member A precursor [Salmo salar]